MGKRASLKNKAVTVTGIIVPVEWNENGNPVVIAISSHDEQEFIIDNRNKKGKKLEKSLRQNVKVIGKLGKSIKNRKVITVVDYFLMDGSIADSVDSLIVQIEKP